MTVTTCGYQASAYNHLIKLEWLYGADTFKGESNSIRFTKLTKRGDQDEENENNG